MTLAIGDVASDVSMIQMADVGVGISGQEGRQAVMASDFAMGQFRFLVPLLLVHGHWNYQRMGYMILYNFYTNAVFVLILFWYVLFTSFTLTTAITEWSSMLYSIIYTAVPTIDAIPSLVGYWAIFQVAKTASFWLCLLAIVTAAIAPRFVVKFLYQYYRPCDVQIAREFEKFGNPSVSNPAQIEMDAILYLRRR